MLQWFKKISQRAQTGASQRPLGIATGSVGSSPATDQPLRDRDYEFLFNQLLEGISHGWQPARIQRFFESLAERGTIAQWSEWLQRYGAKTLVATGSHTTLARRMVSLGELTRELPDLQQFGETAGGIGRLLLAQERSQNGDESPHDFSIAATSLIQGTIIQPSDTVETSETATESVPIEPIPTELSSSESPPTAPSQPEATTSPSDRPTDTGDTAERIVATEDNQQGRDRLTTTGSTANFPTTTETLAALPLSLPTQILDGQETITLDELMVRLQADESLVHQVAHRLGLETDDPQIIIQELVHQINQRSAATVESTTRAPSVAPEAPAKPNAHEEAERAFNLGVQQYEVGDYEAAIAFWEQAIELKPDYYQAWGNRGLGLKHLKQYEVALTSYDKALAIAPDFYKAWYNRGLVLDELQQYGDAIAAYDQVLALHPDFYKAWYSRGASLEKLHRLTEAIASYDQAIAAKDDFPKAWLSRGNCYRSQSQYELALADYAQALLLQPDDPEVLGQQAATLCEVGQAAQAVEDYTQALAQKPDDLDLLRGRGEAWTVLGQTDRALDDYEQVLAIAPASPTVLFLKAKLLHQLGWEQAANQIYQTLLDGQIPESPDSVSTELQASVWQWRGKLRYQQQNFAEALADYDQALQHQTKAADLWHDRGRALLALERIEEAIASFDRALQLAPEQWEIWCDRAQAAAQSPQADLLLSALSGIAQQDERLNQRGQDGQQATLEAALNAIDREQQPEAWAQLQRQLGHIHDYLGQQAFDEHRSAAWHRAQQHYDRAQEHLNPQTSPAAHLALLTDQMQLALAQEDSQLARAIYEQAQQVWDVHASESTLPRSQQRTLAQYMSLLHQLQVDAHLQQGEFIPAWEQAEFGRNFTLTWLWDGFPLPEGSPQWSDIQPLLNEKTAIVYWQLSSHSLTTFLITLDAAEPIVLGRTPNVVLNLVLSPALRARVELAKQNSQASLDLLLELLGLDGQPENISNSPPAIAPASERDPNLSPQQRRSQLQECLTQWQPLNTASESLIATLPEQLAEFGQLLQIEAIASLLQPKGIENLILVPHQGLHRVPLAALFPNTFTTSVLPSLQFAQLSMQATTEHSSLDDDPWFKPQPETELETSSNAGEVSATVPVRENSGSAMLVWPETHPMVTGWELELLKETVSALTVVKCPVEVTEAVLQEAIAPQHTYVHWLPSSLINPQTPLQSRLQSGDSCSSLAVSTLTNLALHHCHLWSFDQPEQSAMRHSQHTPDEVSATTLLLSRGVDAILKPLWPVEPLVHHLFVVEFYRRLAQGHPVTTAHRQTQHWLQTVTTAELLAWYRAQSAALAARSPIAGAELEALIQAIANELSPTQPPNAPPYAHPYYWAGYVIIGYSSWGSDRSGFS